MTTPPLRSLLEFALDAAWQAGRITLGHFQAGVDIERKADTTPVTVADRGAEQKLRELIGRYWPDHAILGEEYGRQGGASNLTWILDPIDGTKSFVRGVPLYATLVALTENEQPLLGVIHLPALNETVYAARGLGCYWNGRRAQVSAVSELKDALLLTSEPHLYTQRGLMDTFQRLIEATYIQRTWGDAYGYTLVATGRAEVMLDPMMEVWDSGPLQIVLEEAGGAFTDWKGEPTIYGGNAIATNGLLQEQVLQIVRGG